MVALPNPNFSHERIALTKTVTLIYIIDDIFDIYGTLDELILFTEAVKRWDIDVIEQLPHYMKSSLKVVFDITNEIAAEAYNKHGFNPIESLKNSWATLCNAFLVEAKWFASGHIPTSEEYLKNGVVSSGIPLFLAHMFFLLEDCSTKENTCLIHNNNNGIVSSVSKILRLSDDLEGAQHENQDGHDGSYVMCFLKEHDNCSLKNAREYVVEMISDSWKCLNKACLNPNGFSDNFTKGSVNIAKLVALMYTYDDNNSLHLQQEYTRSMICDNC